MKGLITQGGLTGGVCCQPQRTAESGHPCPSQCVAASPPADQPGSSHGYRSTCWHPHLQWSPLVPAPPRPQADLGCESAPEVMGVSWHCLVVYCVASFLSVTVLGGFVYIPVVFVAVFFLLLFFDAFEYVHTFVLLNVRFVVFGVVLFSLYWVDLQTFLLSNFRCCGVCGQCYSVAIVLGGFVHFPFSKFHVFIYLHIL